jgi:cytochrome c556
MRIEKGKLYAVITGDIVNSSKLPAEQRQRLHHIMKEGSNALRKAFKESVPLDADIFRGDSWQLLY